MFEISKDIERDWNSYQEGRDPVLEWVLAYKDETVHANKPEGPVR